MARLSLSLLGSFQVTLDGQPVTGFKSNKVRALLAYLAVEADRPHRREVLAGLLWPDWPDREALSNLRYALSNLRGVIGDRARPEGRDAAPPFLLITRDTLRFNPASDYALDVTVFSHMLELDEAGPCAIDNLQQAVALYQGEFMEGFSVGDSPAFEEWVLFNRERLARHMSAALHRLAATYEQRGQYQPAQSWARRQIELEPWDEMAHQQLMRALALGGQRGAALAQYESCRRLLAEELGVEPAPETRRLYEHIRDGTLPAPAPAPAPPPEPATSLPAFLEAEAPQVEIPVFVARERELAQLERWLDLALSGRPAGTGGRVAFVTGEAGSGKTALVQEFSRRAQEVHGDLLVAGGNCNAYTGIGDPYLPFREILQLLTGDVEARWAAGAMAGEHARRLWHALPVTTQALVEVGPDLIDTFLPRAGLLERATMYAPDGTEWLTRLDELAGHKPVIGPSGMSTPQQADLFEQYTRVLQTLAHRRPLLLVVDDLQWADRGSISLLFHLGRHLAGSRILILGAYRPEEVAIGRDGERHTLEPVVNEFRRLFGDIVVNLGQAESREFVEAFLDSEPNRLGDGFRDMLYRQTRGHPLFTVELLRGLQERGDLIRDAEDGWAEGPALNWETLPARVEAVIAERIGRLAQPLRAALRVASVEGEIFTAEVVACVQGIDQRQMLGHLSRELDRKHSLVHIQAIQRLGSQPISRYRFRHYLCQKYLYEGLDAGERVYLHQDVGNALEELYGDQVKEISIRLAWHFQEAGIAQKAIHYLHQAGERAVHLCAYQEGVAHLTRALDLLMTLPDSPERAQQELTLQLALGLAWAGAKIYPAEEAYTRALQLSQQLGQTSQLCQVLGELATRHYVRAEYRRARELAEEALSLAEQARDPLLIALDHWYLGFIFFGLGEHATARAHLGQTISFYEPEQHHHALVSLRGGDAGVAALAYDACCLWCLGYPDRALKRSQEALALARELGHAFTLADALCYGGCLFNAMRRDAETYNQYAEELKRLASDQVPPWLGKATWQGGEALAMLGDLEEGIRQIREGLALEQSQAESCHRSTCLCALAEAQAKAGYPEEGLATLAEALALMEHTDERLWEPELFRLKGELLLMQGDEADAEASLLKAVEVARRQGAKSWELRATVSLCRLWHDQGKLDQARPMLAEIYAWFTEGFDTIDLKEAAVLLEELS